MNSRCVVRTLLLGTGGRDGGGDGVGASKRRGVRAGVSSDQRGDAHGVDGRDREAVGADWRTRRVVVFIRLQ